MALTFDCTTWNLLNIGNLLYDLKIYTNQAIFVPGKNEGNINILCGHYLGWRPAVRPWPFKYVGFIYVSRGIHCTKFATFKRESQKIKRKTLGLQTTTAY